VFGKLFKSEAKEPERPRKRASQAVKSAHTKTTRKLHERIAVADLRVGMFVVELDKPWEESGFMFQGLELKSPADVIAVQNECTYVFVDYDEFSLGEKAPASSGLPAAGVGATRDQGVQVEDEIGAAEEVHSLASKAISSLFEGTAQHSLNVSALSIVVAKSMGMSVREMEDIGVCAMLHDVGKTSVSTEVLNKQGKLEPDELAEMRKHAQYGRDILVSTKSVMSGAADVAHSHHERPDGTGYPRKLTSDSIPMFAQIVAIAESYDVMTTTQPYRQAVSPSDALQELYALRGKQFDEDLVIRFIDAVGIFPPGSIVEMLNGEIGIVLSNTNDKLRPTRPSSEMSRRIESDRRASRSLRYSRSTSPVMYLPVKQPLSKCSMGLLLKLTASSRSARS